MEYLIFLRLVHIVCAVIWTGGMIFYAVFVIPAAKSLGPEGTKFIQRLSATNKLPIIMSVNAIFAIVTGILLMQKLLGGIQLAFKSTHGMMIIIGALLALLGFIIGIMINIPASRRMNAIGRAIAASGSQPNAAQIQELQKLRNKSFVAAFAVAFLLFASLILMSVVKYY
jgi:uncharacterized membrane protein